MKNIHSLKDKDGSSVQGSYDPNKSTNVSDFDRTDDHIISSIPNPTLLKKVKSVQYRRSVGVRKRIDNDPKKKLLDLIKHSKEPSVVNQSSHTSEITSKLKILTPGARDKNIPNINELTRMTAPFPIKFTLDEFQQKDLNSSFQIDLTLSKNL